MYKINGKDHPVLLATETIAYFEAYLGSGDIYIQVYRKSGFYKNFKINVRGNYFKNYYEQTVLLDNTNYKQ